MSLTRRLESERLRICQRKNIYTRCMSNTVQSHKIGKKYKSYEGVPNQIRPMPPNTHPSCEVGGPSEIFPSEKMHASYLMEPHATYAYHATHRQRDMHYHSVSKTANPHWKVGEQYDEEACGLPPPPVHRWPRQALVAPSTRKDTAKFTSIFVSLYSIRWMDKAWDGKWERGGQAGLAPSRVDGDSGGDMEFKTESGKSCASYFIHTATKKYSILGQGSRILICRSTEERGSAMMSITCALSFVNL